MQTKKYYRVMDEAEAIKLALGKTITGRSTEFRYSGKGVPGVCFFGDTIHDARDGENFKEYTAEEYYNDCYLARLTTTTSILVEFSPGADCELTAYNEASMFSDSTIRVYSTDSYNSKTLIPTRFKIAVYDSDPVDWSLENYKVRWHEFTYEELDKVFSSLSVYAVAMGDFNEYCKREKL